MLRRLILLVALAAACQSAPTPEPAGQGPGAAPDAGGATPAQSIAVIEAFGEDPGGALIDFVATGEPTDRRSAALALGRLSAPRSPAGTRDALVRALGDDDAAVRAAAAFALGQREEPDVADALRGALSDADPGVRAAAVTAASRCAPGELLESILFAIGDPEAIVRSAALVAPHRFDSEHAGAPLVDAALTLFASRAPQHLLENQDEVVPGTMRPADTDEVALALFSLARRKAERGRGVFRVWAQPGAPDGPRLFALRGLSGLEIDAESQALLRVALAADDWRIAVEGARGLARQPEVESLPALRAALEHNSVHVRRVAIESLAAFTEQRDQIRALLEHASIDRSASVRAAVIATRAKLWGTELAADLEMLAFDADPVVRAGVAEAAAALPTESAIPLLTSLARDRFPRVAGTAVAGFGKHLQDPEARQRLHILLSHEDGGLRLAALGALGEDPSPADLPHLEFAWRSSRGEIANEIRMEVLHRAAALEGDRARELLWLGVLSEEPYLTELARRLLAEREPDVAFPPLPPVPGERPTATPTLTSAPLVELRTTRGTLLFELWPDDAPRHVHNFTSLVRAGHYDGLDWHRVVPDFVAQGGDHRGDGNGSRTANGAPLRREFNDRPYVHGTLGMPRNENPDSGGSQLFVCHRPTPHLDGRYVAFGELVQGFEVLDALEVGDRILSARVRGAGQR